MFRRTSLAPAAGMGRIASWDGLYDDLAMPHSQAATSSLLGSVFAVHLHGSFRYNEPGPHAPMTRWQEQVRGGREVIC